MTTPMTHSPSHTAAQARPADGLDQGNAMADFRHWYSACGAAGKLRVTSPGLLEVDSKLSDEFMIGTLGNRFFIGVPPDVCTWFLRAPWLHLAVRPGFGGLALVCGKLSNGRQAMREFALYFDGVHVAAVNSLANYHYIDIRQIISNGDLGTRSVSRKAAMTMEVVPVSGERNLETFMSGRSASIYRAGLSRPAGVGAAT